MKKIQTEGKFTIFREKYVMISWKKLYEGDFLDTSYIISFHKELFLFEDVENNIDWPYFRNWNQ